jgi:hypothetical protein
MWAEVDKMMDRSGTPDALDGLERKTYAYRFGGFRTAPDERSLVKTTKKRYHVSCH